MAFMCKIGLHDWGPWTQQRNDDKREGRRCGCCFKVQHRMIGRIGAFLRIRRGVRTGAPYRIRRGDGR